MAIQTINLAVPGGDTPRSANTKINANFTDLNHAASRLVGKGGEELSLNKNIHETLISITAYGESNNDLSTITKFPSINYALPNTTVGAPPSNIFSGVSAWIVEYKTGGRNATSSRIQQAIPATNKQVSGAFRYEVSTGVFSDWVADTTNTAHYNTTTALGANVVVDAYGKLMRSTSSERYKDILAPLELDDTRYADAMALKPIVYRSTAGADNPQHHFYSFSAEELGTYDPAFTLWRYTEQVTDADGNTTEQPLAERQAEGININALLAMSHAIAIKQDSLIKDLQDQVGDLQSAVATLQATNNP